MQQNELYHYGVKGMKWGVRRAQNKALRKEISNYRQDKTREYEKKLGAHKEYANAKKYARGTSEYDKHWNNALKIEKQSRQQAKQAAYAKYGKKVVDKFDRQDLAKGYFSMGITVAALVGGYAAFVKGGEKAVDVIIDQAFKR